jgi:excisionase family DNA binding protein
MRQCSSVQRVRGHIWSFVSDLGLFKVEGQLGSVRSWCVHFRSLLVYCLMDLKALRAYACVSERTLREWIHRPVNPLPASQVGGKMLIRRSAFDSWLEEHQVKSVDVGCIVEELVAGVTGTY